jgi:hypothetical protein
MADTPISGLPEVTVLADDDWITAVDISDISNNATGENVKIQKSNLLPTVEMELIEKITLNVGSPGQFDFTSIPQTYDHLYLDGIVRSSEPGSAGQWTYLHFNGDALRTNYYTQAAGGYSGAANVTDEASSRLLFVTTSGETANQWADVNIYIKRYTRTDVIKGAEGIGSARIDAALLMTGHSAMYHDTMDAAITRLTLEDQDHPTYQLYGELSLYGITRPT